MLRIGPPLLLLLVGAAPAAAPPAPEPLPAGAKLRIGPARLRHGGLVRGLAFAPDGRSLASAGHDQTVSLWEVPSGRERFRFRGHQGDVLAVAFSPDGKLVASGGSDGTVRLWAAAGPGAGRAVHVVSLPADNCEALAFDPTGRWLAVGGEDGTVRLIATASRKVAFSFSLDRAVRTLAWSHDGKLLAAGGDRPGVTLWDAQAGRAGKTFGDVTALCLAFAPTGTALATWEAGGSLALWDAVSGKRRWQGRPTGTDPGGAAGIVYQITFSPDGKHLLAGNPRGGLDRFDLDGWVVGRVAPAHGGRVTAVAASGGLIATGGSDHAVRLWHAATLAPAGPAPDSTGPVVGLALAPRGDRLLAVYGGGEARLFDLDTGRRLAAKLPPTRAAVFTSARAASLVTTQGRLARWDGAEDLSRLLPKEEPPLVGIAADAGGRKVLTGHADGVLWLRDAAGRRGRTLEGLAWRATPLLSADGRLAAAVGPTASIALWDARTHRARPALAGHRGGTLAGVFTADGKRLVSGGRDRMLRVWDLTTGREARRGMAHDGWVTAVAASPDGKLLASGTAAGDLSLWWAATGHLLAEIEGHRGAVSALTMTADGKTLVSGGQDTTVLVWDLADLQDGKPRPVALTATRAEELWGRMRDPSLATATVAMSRLARDPTRALAVVRGKVEPVDAAAVAKLIGQLDGDEFSTRERAGKALAALGKFVEGPMETALTKKPSLHAAQELRRLLRLADAPGPTLEHRRALLAADLLATVATPEAIALLRRLAGGAPDAELTRRARSALAKVGKR